MLRVAEETGADLVIGARRFDRALMPPLPLLFEYYWQPPGVGTHRPRDSGQPEWIPFVPPGQTWRSQAAGAGTTNSRWKS